MNKFNMLLIFFLILINFINGQVNITKVEKVGPQSVEIEWSTNDMGRDFKRYSVQIFESDSLSYTDWSAQTETTPDCYDVKKTIRIIINVTNFECQTECILNSSCMFYEISRNNLMKQNVECILKSEDSDITAHTLISTTTDSFNTGPLKSTSINKICGKINEYSNSAIIKNLSYGKVYIFRVKLFDATKNQWSDYSELSQSVSISINLNINIERLSTNDINVKWNEFNEYLISKYKLFLYENGIYHSEFSDYAVEYLEDFYSNYDTINENENETVVNNIEECHSLCLNRSNSIRGVYYENQISPSTCFCKTSFDLHKSILKNEDSTTFFMKSTTRNYTIQNLKINSIYQIILECVIPFSTKPVDQFSFSYTLSEYPKPTVVKLDEFKIGNSGRLLCYSLINESIIELIWYKNGVKMVNSENAQLLDNNKIINFNKYENNNFGSYSCELKLNGSSNSDIRIMSNILVLEATKNDHKFIVITSVLSATSFIFLILSVVFIILFIRQKKGSKGPNPWFEHQNLQVLNNSIETDKSIQPDKSIQSTQPPVSFSNRYERNANVPAIPEPSKKPSIKKKDQINDDFGNIYAN